ncbi:MAG TPA: hypothetical protein ENI20_19605 [Bacteroides sp.]|nr:hypothetical protein [Bacteroides sp.]
MKRFLRPRILMLAAGLALMLMFAFPLWRITLEAPQYPKGLSMFIWVNKITGSEPSTLQNINIMNHYIGMKAIEPDSIPELQFMQYIIIVFAGLAFLLAWLNKWQANLVWLVILVGAGALAIYDFYLWEYDYGHNLDPHAAIKIEGMAYQPPLIGKKIILNFTALSWPQLGSLFMTLSMILGTLSVFKGRKQKRIIG